MKKLRTFLIHLRLGLYKRRDGITEKELQTHGFNKETFPLAEKVLQKLYESDPKFYYSRRFLYSIEEVMEELLELRERQQKQKKGKRGGYNVTTTV